MLQRLYASLVKGPSLNARPHNSRQRVDLTEIDALQGFNAASLVDSLLGPSLSVDCPAKVSRFVPPSAPEQEWTREEKRAQSDYLRQSRLLNKFHDISIDARDYFNDHGEDALFVAYPMLSVPAIHELNTPSSPRVLAPIAFMPVSLSVKRGSRPGIQLKATGEGADLLLPNPALLAWVEQQTGKEIDDLFGDEEGEDPWKELREILGLVTSAMGIRDSIVAPRLPIESIPKIGELPAVPTILPCAVLGLFPTTNPGLMRDTKWMMEREKELEAPVNLFLNRNVLEVREEARPTDEIVENGDIQGTPSGYNDESLVTQADPCQAEAVLHARSDQAIVIHGPPGTGKSQTIANIIGDHLAREKRVLFVCDKRTALDVVKYRLDALGLGDLCGVIHDVQRDRRGLYMGIRERLEHLAEEDPPKSPSKRLQTLNEKLDALRNELQAYYDTLHSDAEERGSFHNLVGRWMALRMKTADYPEELLKKLSGSDDFNQGMIEDFLADIDECLQHAANAELGRNPFYGQLRLTLSEFMAGHIDDLAHLLERVHGTALELDSFLKGDPVNFNRDKPLDPQRNQLAAIREASVQVKEAWQERVVVAVAQLDAERLGVVSGECNQLDDEVSRLRESVDLELERICPFGSIGLDEIDNRILVLEAYLPAASSWTRVFAFGKRKATEQILTPLGITADLPGIERALKFHRHTRSALLVAGFLDRLTNRGGDHYQSLSGVELVEHSAAVVAMTVLCKQVSESAFSDPLFDELSSHVVGADSLSVFIDRLELSMNRGGVLDEYENRVRALKLFSDEAIEEFMRLAYQCDTCSERTQSWIGFKDSLEDVLRFERRIGDMPGGLLGAVTSLGCAGVDPSKGVKLLHRVAVEKELSSRVKSEPNLVDITSERVEAALKEFGQRLGQKELLVRELALFNWRGRQHERLMASNGSRLNSLGASLRQRLFLRGKRALKLRQMIQSGQNIEGGDPLFDLCPVWMASPSTVAQIFPRETLFDVIVFDEASQCRLEEALPVLLRGKRVVIAGDPKQLPPTRFFESAVGDSEYADAESLEELQEQQISETEDLLSAALNLDLQACYLDVHYRSQSEALIGFSNEAFYQSRLQPIPGHPKRRPKQSPLKVYRVDGTYQDRSNPAEAEEVSDLVVKLLDQKKTPSIGIACFNLNQRDLIIRSLEKRATADREFSRRLEEARNRQGKGSFEGLFVKNLENVQGDERDHIIISTTFGTASDGKFRRHFGALSRYGGERRLNVLVTRAREMIHVFTSIPREEYVGDVETDEPVNMTGRQYLYRFLRFAETVESEFQISLESEGGYSNQTEPASDGLASSSVSIFASRLSSSGEIYAESPWGNEGFCVDVAMREPDPGREVSLGVFLDFNRYRKTPDPIKWEHFRSAILKQQGWDIRRVWSPELFRKDGEVVADLIKAHQARLAKSS
ncbi:AAA domain-containing protein [Verrucomicrobia bacterium]|nr:AAA domain-containing protein [Verrucomicrobiota bacterium]